MKTDRKTGLMRLLQLADHLEHGKLGHQVFNFNQWNTSNIGTCGTAGCAVGECPIVWPEEWSWDRFGHPLLNTQADRDQNPLSSAEEFFGIRRSESEHLFIPNRQRTSVYGGVRLPYEATKEQVAANIRIFVEKQAAKFGIELPAENVNVNRTKGVKIELKERAFGDAPSVEARTFQQKSSSVR